MMIKHVLLIDDEPENWVSVSMLKERLVDDQFIVGRDLYDADSYVFDEGIEFEVMIIDFALGEYYFSEVQDQKMLEELNDRKKYLVGWVWINYFLRKHPNYNPKRIIGLSAYTDLLSEQEIKSSGIRVFDKRDRNCGKKILEVIKKIPVLKDNKE